jgi:alcohol dehydrogenase
MIDKDEGRPKVAKNMGAIHTLNPATAAGTLREMTKEHHGDIDGFDVVVEAVGVSATFEICQELVGKGGSIANVGVHCAKVDLSLEKLWGKGIRKSSFEKDQDRNAYFLRFPLRDYNGFGKH